MPQTAEIRSPTCPLDMSELQQTLHSIVDDPGFFEVFDEFASTVALHHEQIWLQIDGEATLDDPMTDGDEDNLEVTEWVVHSSFGDLPEPQASGVSVHARARNLAPPPSGNPFPVGLCFQDATLTLSRSGSAVPDDEFLAKAQGPLSALSEGGPVVMNRLTIGKVITNSGGLCQIRFNANCSLDGINTVLSHLAYRNAQAWCEDGIAIDWSFCCFYIGLRHEPEEQVFVGSQFVRSPDLSGLSHCRHKSQASSRVYNTSPTIV